MAEASPLTQEHVRKSYQVLAILETCRMALDVVRKDHAGADCGNIGAALGVALDIAGELHNEVESRVPYGLASDGEEPA